ncbi:MAG: tyrosine-type recombinase/integrase [Solirubrobacterales bacterium]|nr:tyrosine-type recombinase/integrase [Solirubrobacterales bacterium]MBV9942160.1 tyrosine-type recombinase/integrase [Solirubrobacterales bacterium]
MRHAAHARYGNRINGLIVVLGRAGLRINEALSLIETDLEEQRGSILVRHGKNDRRQVGMDAWGWTALGPWLAERAALPVGPLFCVIAGPTVGHAWSASAARLQRHQVAVQAGVRRRFPPHQLRHAHAVDRARRGTTNPSGHMRSARRPSCTRRDRLRQQCGADAKWPRRVRGLLPTAAGLECRTAAARFR